MDQLQSVKLVRWIARLLSLALFLFWGGFFVEHTSEWFAHFIQQPPPLRVVLTHSCHFLLLAGLLAGWFWEGLGGAMIVLFSVLFFGSIGAMHFLFITAVPGVLFLVSWYLSRQVPKGAI